MKKIIVAILFLLINTTSLLAWADRCDYDPGSGPVNLTVPLSVANISVGADVPVGSTVHTLKVIGSTGKQPWLVCRPEGTSNGFSIDQYLSLTNAPALVPGWTGNYAGAVFQTGVPGLGVAIVNNDGTTANQAITTSAVKKWTTPVGNTAYHFYYGNSFTLHFIKTGPMSAGTVNGAQLPTVLLTTGSVTPVVNIPDTPYRLNFSGSLNVIAASCTTPDVNVNMGKWEINSWFGTGKANATSWVPFDIRLTNCPAFQGNYSNPSAPPTYHTGSGFAAGTWVTNSIKIRFTPSNGVIDAAQSIMSLDNSADSAQGIGIQIADGKVSPAPVNLNQTLDKNMASNAVGTVLLPFSARYIKTGGTVSPGVANGKVIFNISYY
ncbi:fimbrial protein [Pantoea sp. SO10]|uniref:fimbrial protein n=1 Tax=Pantoea sp. SO10 TaxID=2575375 RepID=UPI0010C9EAA8|nr:fimbrial protein [Pantoea sp. SO10]QCP62186.1 hypothetical protein FCN45_22635 [Pantoea sp. SO10]